MNTALPDRWPSLHPQLALAAELYGNGGERRVGRWLARQIARIDDTDFARRFTDHIDLPGVGLHDYTHRLVRASRGTLIGGIRFYGTDVARPFVDVIAHDFVDLEALTAVVAHEWRRFRPLHLRLCRIPDPRATLGTRSVAPSPSEGSLSGAEDTSLARARASDGIHVDVSVFVARYRDMLGGALEPTGDRERTHDVELVPFGDPDAAMALVDARYETMAREAPSLRRNVSPVDRDHLVELHDSGHLHAVVALGRTVGLIAVAPGRIDWIEGDEVMEEVVASPHAGHRYAARAQLALAAHRSSDLDTLLIGTIDALNAPSRRTAERAGRERVLNYVFVALGR